MKETKYSRRHFLGTATMSLGAAEFTMIGLAKAAQFTDQKQTDAINNQYAANTSFGPLK
jgi:hypothetical protein